MLNKWGVILLLLAFFFNSSFSGAEEVVCDDYCLSDIFYFNGIYNARSEFCEYSNETLCENGCDVSYLTCNSKVILQVCESFCDDGTFFVPESEEAEVCNYTETECLDGCDETGCVEPVVHEEETSQETENETGEAPEVDVENLIIVTGPAEQGTVAEKKPFNFTDVSFNLPNVKGNELFIQYKISDKDFSFQNKIGTIKQKYASQGEVKDIQVEEDEGFPFYVITLINKGKLFWVFPVDLETKVYVNVTDLEDKIEKKSWWFGLVKKERDVNLIDTFVCNIDGDCLQFDDGDLCTGIYYCEVGEGVAPRDQRCEINPSSVIDCDDLGEDCRINSCNPKNGKCEVVDLPEETICAFWEDSFCREKDVCSEGECTEGAFDYENESCQCEDYSDCAALENGDLCDGTLYCNKFNFQCEIIPFSVIHCGSGADTNCMKNVCDSETGKCSLNPVEEGGLCDDGNICTIGDSCTVGLCVSGKENVCECEQNSDCAALENGNLCDGTLYCNKLKNKCELNPSTVINCQSVNDNYCRKNTCDATTGECEMKPVNVGEICWMEDGCFDSVCTEKGTCEGNWNFDKTLSYKKCQCMEDVDCENFEDGDVCNGILSCDKWTNTCELNPATIINCQSVNDDYCRKNTCNAITGECEVKPKNVGEACIGAGGIDALCTVEGLCGE